VVLLLLWQHEGLHQKLLGLGDDLHWQALPSRRLDYLRRYRRFTERQLDFRFYSGSSGLFEHSPWCIVLMENAACQLRQSWTSAFNTDLFIQLLLLPYWYHRPLLTQRVCQGDFVRLSWLIQNTRKDLLPYFFKHLFFFSQGHMFVLFFEYPAGAKEFGWLQAWGYFSRWYRLWSYRTISLWMLGFAFALPNTSYGVFLLEKKGLVPDYPADSAFYQNEALGVMKTTWIKSPINGRIYHLVCWAQIWKRVTFWE